MAMEQLKLNLFMTEQKSYSKEDLAIFRKLIDSKLEIALVVLQEQKEIMTGITGNDTSDTSWSFRPDDAQEYSNKQEAAIIAHKQEVFILSLRNAILRIDNGTYGICVNTGNLIDRNRLMAVPGTATCLISKNQIKYQIIPLENSQTNTDNYEKAD